MMRIILIPALLLPLAAQAETPNAKLQRYASDAGQYFNVGGFSARWGTMPGRGDVWGYALRNMIVINPSLAHQDRDLAETVCHEVRHVWQYRTGFRMDFSVDYWDQPHEIDARKHQVPCANAIMSKSPNQTATKPEPEVNQSPTPSPIQPTGDSQHNPEPQPTGNTVELPQPDDDTMTVIVWVTAIAGIAAFIASRSKKDGERIDYNSVFVIVARLLIIAAMALVAWQYALYFDYFGIGALAFIGQFLIGTFFVAAAIYSRTGAQLLTSAAGMFLLVNSF